MFVSSAHFLQLLLFFYVFIDYLFQLPLYFLVAFTFKLQLFRL